MKNRQAWLISVSVVLVCVFLGCQPSARYSDDDLARVQRPTIQVTSFVHKGQPNSSFGRDLADELVKHLIQTRRYIVLDRPAATTAAAPAKRRGFFSRKPAPSSTTSYPASTSPDYLIQGTITDFGWVSLNTESAGSESAADAGYWIAAVDLEIVNADNLVLARKRLEGRVKGQRPEDNVNAQGMAFGGYTFYQSSLGRATGELLEKSVSWLAANIKEIPYQPKIASVQENQVIINGGKDRNMHIGREFFVRTQSEEILDPDTGKTLGYVAGHIIGKVRIVQVTEKFSIAAVEDGTGFAPGQPLFDVTDAAQQEWQQAAGSYY